jgi:hypothetical protein
MSHISSVCASNTEVRAALKKLKNAPTSPSKLLASNNKSSSLMASALAAIIARPDSEVAAFIARVWSVELDRVKTFVKTDTVTEDESDSILRFLVSLLPARTQVLDLVFSDFHCLNET